MLVVDLTIIFNFGILFDAKVAVSNFDISYYSFLVTLE